LFWKKRKSPEHQVKADMSAIVASLGPKWKLFCQQMPFKAEVPLWQQIEAFATPAIAGMMQHYPSTKAAPPGLLWMMVFTAILDSNTHPAAEVNAAIATLEAKYAGG
jgi:hypothetical protein